MRSTVLCVVLLLVMGVVLGSATALAAPSRNASNPTTTRSTYSEWVVQETEAGPVRVPVTVHRVTVVETVIVPRAEP
ncbi:MAG: hypothetical protein GXX94_01020 [Chloroflexi bacterium]|jgi:hypothetical protein|nr:hypothetical protein [Chloroflexota bacterium]